MKKIAVILLLVTLLSVFCACVNTPNAPANPNEPNTPNTPNNPTTPADPNKPEPTKPEPSEPSDDDVTIKFVTGGGAFADGRTALDVIADANGNVAMTEEPRKDGHAFIGWYCEETKFDSQAAYTVNQTFTARYVSGGEAAVYNALFDEQSAIAIDINMSDAEWKKLNQDYIDFAAKNSQSPIYRMADSVTISIDSGNGFLNYYYEEVGVRMKGNTSRHKFYNDNGFTNNIHMKLSFKQTFDDIEDGYKEEELKVWQDKDARSARKARTLGGMEKIDVKYNSTYDETYVKELYAMKTFRDNGIYAPNVTLCSLTALEKDVTKKNMGVYRIHEPIDEVFITRHIEETIGDLYKCTYSKKGPADLTNYDLENRVGVEDELNGEFYSYDKKTNKKKDKVTGLRDFSSIKNFIAAINESSPDFESLIDTDYFAKFEAINYILGNPDCIRNNANNYYLYFRSDGKALIIPYDYDRCLGITSWDPTAQRDPNSPALINVTPFTRTVAATGDGQLNPLYVKLIDKGANAASGSVLMRYRQNLINLSTADCFAAATFEAYKNNYKTKYAAFTETAIKSNGMTFDAANTGNLTYAAYIQAKFNTLNNNIDNYNP